DQFEDISNPVAGGYGATSIQYAKLVKAYTLDKKAALKSASWGKFQILASNYATAGYASPEDFVFALSKSEKNQLKAFVSFIKADRVLLRSIRTKDWLSFAQRYNGPRQKGYDLKMERNYNASL
ncbi:TPA: N-acetylmuramidase domain-containing protein, partial [Escherichia coli]